VQWDGGKTTDSDLGILKMQTLRKEPTTAPKTKAKQLSMIGEINVKPLSHLGIS